MKKKAVIFTMLAVLMAVPVFAAVTDQAQAQNEGTNQIFQKHQTMMQQAVDNGTITTEEAAHMNKNMQEMAPVMQKMMQNGPMMNGMMQNSSMMGNCNNNNNTK